MTTEDVLVRLSLTPEIRKRLKEVARSGKCFLEGSSSCTCKDWEEVSSEEKLKGSKGKR